MANYVRNYSTKASESCPRPSLKWTLTALIWVSGSITKRGSYREKNKNWLGPARPKLAEDLISRGPWSSLHVHGWCISTLSETPTSAMTIGNCLDNWESPHEDFLKRGAASVLCTNHTLVRRCLMNILPSLYSILSFLPQPFYRNSVSTWMRLRSWFANYIPTSLYFFGHWINYVPFYSQHQFLLLLVVWIWVGKRTSSTKTPWPRLGPPCGCRQPIRQQLIIVSDSYGSNIDIFKQISIMTSIRFLPCTRLRNLHVWHYEGAIIIIPFLWMMNNLFLQVNTMGTSIDPAKLGQIRA